MTGPLILALAFVLYGLANIVFAFREPPAALASVFRVPAIFALLPEAYRARVGRIAVGALCMLTPALVALRVSSSMQ